MLIVQAYARMQLKLRVIFHLHVTTQNDDCQLQLNYYSMGIFITGICYIRCFFNVTNCIVTLKATFQKFCFLDGH